MIKKFVIIALILFLVGCHSMPPREILVYKGTVKRIEIFNGSRGTYTSITFEGDWSVSLENIENNIRPGEKGKLYVRIVGDRNFLYHWEKL